GWVRMSGVLPSASSLARSRRTYTRTYSVSVSYPCPHTRRSRCAWVSSLPRLVASSRSRANSVGVRWTGWPSLVTCWLARSISMFPAVTIGGPGSVEAAGLGRRSVAGIPGHPSLGAEGLGHGVAGANVERGPLPPPPAAGRHHDDRHAGLLADLPAQLEAVDLGQHQVEQDDVRLLGLQQLQCPGAVGGHHA